MLVPPWTTWQTLALFLSVAVARPAWADPWPRALAQRFGVGLDESLSRAARAHAAAVARAPDPTSPDVRPALAAQGLGDAQVEVFAALGAQSALEARALAFAEARTPHLGPTRVGVGRTKRADDREVLVVLWSRRLLETPPLGPRLRAGEQVLRAALVAGRAARLFVTLPTGEVVEAPVTATGRQLQAIVDLSARGSYDLEWLVETERGPEVGALWHVAVDIPVATAEVLAPVPDAGALALAVNELRRTFERPALPSVRALASAAEQHAAAVCGRGVAAHVLGSGTPETRARAAGWTGAVAENVAVARSLAEAHAQILDSPSHRLNVLLEAAVGLGVGVARAGERVCLVELFGVSDSRPTASR